MAQKRAVGRVVRREAKQAAQAAAGTRARAVQAASRTGGDFPTSLRTGPNSDQAAARTAKRIGHDIVAAPDGHYYAHVKRDLLPDRHVPVDPFTGKVDRKYQADPKSGQVEAASVNAPALKVLDQTTRPIHAIAGAAKEDVKVAQQKGVAHYLAHGGGAPARKAAVRGAELKDRTLFSDVLKQAGVKNKGVAAAGGFALDVVADPTTYLTGGTGSIAEHAAARAGAKVAAKAAKAGMSEEGAATVARQAAKRAAAKAPAGKGVTVKLAGQEVPGVRRATGAVARGARAATRKVAPTASRTVPSLLRRAVRDVAPRVRPAEVTEAQFVGARAASRTARAQINTAEQRAMQLAQELRRKLKPDDYQQVVDAIERNDLSRLLSKELATSARQLRDALRGARRQSRRAGVASGHAVGDTSRSLANADLKRLDNSVQAEQRAQKRAISRSVTKEQTSRERALVTEAVGSQTGRRAQNAATRYERKAATTLLSTQKLKAAQAVPKLRSGESHAAYLQNVIQHASAHDLPLVKARAEKLLQKVPQDVARGYFPREFEPRVLKKLGLTPEEAVTRATTTGAAGPSRKVGATTAGFARGEKRTLRVVNPERAAAGREPFSTNVPLVAVNHLRNAARATSQGEFAKNMAKLGRQVSSPDDLKPGEAIFKLGYQGGQFGLHVVRGIPAKATKGGQYVALDGHLLASMQETLTRQGARSEIGKAIDKTTGGFKRLATATFAFHLRNLVGDIQTAYTVPGVGGSLPKALSAGKAVRRASQQARSLEVPASHATVKVAGKRQGVDEFLKGARENGVLDTGYIGRELHDLTGRSAGAVGKVRRDVKAAKTVDRWMTNRENLMRLATYKHGLDRGMSPAEAADLSNHFHIDYGELSSFEKTWMRRVFPFYTWTARSLPLTARTLVTTPGKFANIEKAREETAKGFGLDEEATRRGMSEAISRQVPFVVKVGKGAHAVSASLPVTLLNELPTGASKDDLSAYLSELGRFGFQMLNPIAKIPIELQAGVSLYTRQPIENPQRPLTAAPSWVQWLPEKIKRDLDVTPSYVDKRTGKKTWGWRGRADYASRQVPGAPQQAATLASGGRPGQPKDYATAALGVAGVRVDSLNAQAVKRTKEVAVYRQLAKLNRQAAILNQQGINSDHPTPEYKSLRKQINALTHQVRPLKGRKRKAGPLPLGGGTGGKLPLGGGSSAKLPLG